MTENDGKIYDAALEIVACAQSQRYILKELYDMEEHANTHGGDFQGLSNIISKMTDTIDKQTWEIISIIGM